MHGLLRNGLSLRRVGGKLLRATPDCKSQCCGGGIPRYRIYVNCDAYSTVCPSLIDDHVAIRSSRIPTDPAYNSLVFRVGSSCYRLDGRYPGHYTINGEDGLPPIPAGTAIIPDDMPVEFAPGVKNCDSWEECDSNNTVVRASPCPNQVGTPPPVYVCGEILECAIYNANGFCYSIEPGGERVDINELAPGAIVVPAFSQVFEYGKECCDCVTGCEQTAIQQDPPCMRTTPPTLERCCCVNGLTDGEEGASTWTITTLRGELHWEPVNSRPHFHSVYQVYDPATGSTMSGTCGIAKVVKIRVTTNIDGYVSGGVSYPPQTTVYESDHTLNISCSPPPHVSLGFVWGIGPEYQRMSICLENSPPPSTPNAIWAEYYNYHRTCRSLNMSAKWHNTEAFPPVTTRYTHTYVCNLRINPKGNCAGKCADTPVEFATEPADTGLSAGDINQFGRPVRGCSGCRDANTGGATL